MEESPSERSTSSAPCSGRPSSYDDVTEHPLRKKQRTSHAVPRSRSVDEISKSNSSLNDTTLLIDPPELVQKVLTPTHDSSQVFVDQSPSKVTINIRTNHSLNTISSSPPISDTMKHLQPSHDSQDTQIIIESESDEFSTATPSSSPILVSSPHVELLPLEDTDLPDQDPPIALIDENEDENGDANDINDNSEIFSKFPYRVDGEALSNTLNRLFRFFQCDEVVSDEVFCKIHDWIDMYLLITTNTDIFYENFVKNQEFWASLPEIVWALSHRQKYLGDFLRRSREGRQALTNMFCQFGRLTSRFLIVDLKILSSYPSELVDEPILGSQPYLHALGHLLHKDETPHIGKTLEVHYHWNFDDDISQICYDFKVNGGTISALKKYMECQLRLQPLTPYTVEKIVYPCRIVEILISESISLNQESRLLEDNEMNVDTVETSFLMSYDLFLTISSALENIINKHITSLSPDAVTTLLHSLAYILKSALSINSQFTQRIFKEKEKKFGMISTQDYPVAISVEWKFKILKKLINCAQMQLRVIGVTTMCTELLQLHYSNRALDIGSSPILLYFANYILENKLVDYVVGTGSHPEIINESSNIIGFLMVTKTYKPQQTDIIWHTVKTCQDQRVVDAILRMLSHCHNLFDGDNLLYLCTKAIDIRLESFTPAMRDLFQALFKNLMTKASAEAVVPAPPYHLCVRLIRESSKLTEDNIVNYSEIQIWAASRFREILSYGPSSWDRLDIYQQCMKDILLKSKTAPGSLCVINTLLSSDDYSELIHLTTDYDLTRLLIDELEDLASADNISYIQLLRTTPAGHACRNLLLRIIKAVPGTITPDLGERLWNTLVGTKSQKSPETNSWWQTLNAAAKQSQRNNIFLTRCFQDYLPKLPPHCFTPGALEFAREAVLNWLEDAHYDLIEDKKPFKSLAIEQIWHMVLTASSNTIEESAINILVEIYVHSALITSITRPKAHIIHLDLINRCLNQLKGAALELKNLRSGTHRISDGKIDSSTLEDQFQAQEKICIRSLAVLREFLRVYYLKPQFSNIHAKSLTLQDASDEVDGDPVTFKYQSFDGNNHTEVESIVLGHKNNLASLLSTLQKVTGFKSFKIYCGGREFIPSDKDMKKSVTELNLKGLLLVKYYQDIDTDIEASSTIGKTAIEQEIIKHFDDLWSYLGMHEEVAREIYNFLKNFPIYDHLIKCFNSDTNHSEIFPTGQPFKSLYAIHGLRELINPRSPSAMLADEAMLFRAVSLIVATISDPTFFDSCANNELKNLLLIQLINCLILFLKKPLPPSSISSLLDKNLLEHMLKILMETRLSNESQSHHVTSILFESIIESSIHSLKFWEAFLSHLKNSMLLRELLLESPHYSIRKGAAKVILEKCTQFTNSLVQVSSITLVSELWPLVLLIIPDVLRYPQNCEQLLSVSYSLFKKVVETSAETLKIEDLVRQWGILLVSHTSLESPDQPENIDMVAQGLGIILHYATSVAKSAKQSLFCGNLGTKIFRKHLFPALSDVKDDLISPNIPILNSKTRGIISETVFYLIKDDDAEYWEVLLSIDSLIPYNASPDHSPYSFDLSFLFEKNKSVRSQTGYVGLRNPSNTCYLNSLLTQLFMNISFRSFMLSALVFDGGASQKLLSETQSLFSHMQHSYKRFVDPEKLASSIQTYEETQIDVTVQMDVDEFYNLLFDRWESQMLAPDAKNKFRSFYGGQLVQQVKSRECPHVSEMLEPFSAIQCDIKGKSCLEESLQAYVDGEVMEGENKYKCSTCDRHVDAVKRACLKEIPDNLIFHLKRFDFNLRTLQRNKINDRFSFPNKIDMNPYKVEYLMNNTEVISEDIFILVGILVHSGTAESGHYYSYIRERPSNQNKEKWFEFNDECVSSWDPASIEGSCFGGPDYQGQTDNSVIYDKSWSAYMLFYQRYSSTNSQNFHCAQQTPARIPIPKQIFNHIAVENELLLRKYCLYDSSHTLFMMKMLQNLKKFNSNECDAISQHLKKIALRVAFNHLDQVVSRTKDLPDFSTYMLQLIQSFRACAENSRLYLEWLCECREALCQLLIKNPEQLIRKEIASSIILTLCKVKSDTPSVYGFLDSEDSDDEQEDGHSEIFEKVIGALTNLWDIIHTGFRAWPEYFGLLTNIARIGPPEAATILSKGYLNKTLDIITADPNLPLTVQYTKMLNIISKRNATRPISYEAVISLLWQMMQLCDASLEPVYESEERLELVLNDRPIPYTVSERNLLVQYWTRSNSNILTEKLLQINQNEKATEAILIDLLNWDETIDVQIRNTIISGIKQSISSCTCRPFLRAAITYCEHSKDSKGQQIMIVHVSKAASAIEHLEGKDFIKFFKDIMSVKGNSDLSDEELHQFIINQIPTWAPCMLTNYDHDVRQLTEEYIQEFVLNYLLEDEENSDSNISDSKHLNFLRGVSQKLAMRCLEFLLENYIRPRQTTAQGILTNIQAVIEACEETFGEGTPVSRRYVEQRNCKFRARLISNSNQEIAAVRALKKLIVDEAEKETSEEWENSDGDYDESPEFIDGATEIENGTL
ncbi:putative ubiquitin hydrolase [Erysiphe necator]|uniref:Putative ubiquitin hydrolase n=1 Tax=Uncinula necator TaxID=52586 RepID=A0A0B1PBP8_UNCNE|nr:putative ubiquitin hydrolase [Erysiphe necator]